MVVMIIKKITAVMKKGDEPLLTRGTERFYKRVSGHIKGHTEQLLLGYEELARVVL